MLDINSHPIWKNSTGFKKRGHLLRLFVAKQYAKFIKKDKVIGVIGAVGKTTTAIAAKKVLDQKFKVVSTTDTNKTNPNLDPIFNIPMTILRSGPKTEKIILEMGIEIPDEMDYYLSLIKPRTVIVTKLSYEHNEFLGNIDEVFKENLKALRVLDKSGLAILNYDDNNIKDVLDDLRCQVVFYGTDSKNCHVWADNIRIEDFRNTFELNYGVERVEIKSRLLGKHLIYPLLAAAALGVSLDIPLFKIKKALEEVESAPHRLQAIDGFNGSIILDDTYNAQPIAVEEAIETLAQVPARRRILVLGEMRELGEYTEKLHRQIARKIYQNKIDLVFTGTGDVKYTEDELSKLGFVSERLNTGNQNPQLVSKLLKTISKGDVVLLKGAHSVRLDEVVKRITKTKR